MKKYVLKIILSLLLAVSFVATPITANAIVAVKGAALITGGASGSLDSFDGATLNDGDVCFVFYGTSFYFYKLDATSGAAESSPTIIAPDTSAGNKRWILQNTAVSNFTSDTISETTVGAGVTVDGLKIKDSGFALGSDADGDMYYRAAGVLARLAKGAANLKMFMNAGATAPEWAAGISAISFTRDMSVATGNVAYTGAGFKPAAVIVIATIDGQTDTFSVGWQVGTTKGSINVNPVDNKYAITTNFCCYITTGEAAHAQSAVVATYDADGVTITWTRYSDPVVTISGCLFFLR